MLIKNALSGNIEGIISDNLYILTQKMQLIVESGAKSP